MSMTVSELKAFLNMVNGEDVVYIIGPDTCVGDGAVVAHMFYMLTPEMDEGVVLLQYSDDE
nr:MAG TPA: hypothetical protein [Caudoviricetes sp.]